MSTQYSNHRDTPLRRFSSFWLGLVIFGVFGLASAIAYWMIGDTPDVEVLRGEARLKVKSEVSAAQAALLPSDSSVEKISATLKTSPKASDKFVPGTESYKKAMEALSKSSGGGPGFALFQKKTCVTCHGADANTPISPTYPKLAGQSAEYLLAQMKDFHQSKRTNGMSALMKPMMDLCSEEEKKTLAKWISGVKKPAVTLSDAHEGKSLFKAKGCFTCHGENADKPIAPISPRLAGQNAEYLLSQMKAIKDGTRSNGQTAAMKPFVLTLSEKDMKTIAEWLSGKK